MPKGLKLPLGVTSAGRAATVDSDENDQKIIRMALGSDENENAFQQDIGLGHNMVFDVSDATLRAKIVARLTRIFNLFETQKRYKLKRETLVWGENAAEGELTLSFMFINLESDEEKPFRHSFKAGGA